jgi:hypothetical protein
MEVHHHAHLAAGETHTARKKWTHYFWEFLMLFLAVFCGFLAEYQLEHKIEKERGRQYIKSFVEDLKADTGIFSGLIKLNEEKIDALKTIVPCYQALQNNPSDSCLLRLFFASAHFPDFIYTDRTLQQLKNAGGLRLIPAQDADSIIEYDKLLRQYQKIEGTSYQEIQNQIRNSIYSLNNFGKTVKDFSNPRAESTRVGELPLYSLNKDLLNRYFNQLFFYFNGTMGNIEDIGKIDAKAKSLLSFFNNKYNFK